MGRAVRVVLWLVLPVIGLIAVLHEAPTVWAELLSNDVASSSRVHRTGTGGQAPTKYGLEDAGIKFSGRLNNISPSLAAIYLRVSDILGCKAIFGALLLAAFVVTQACNRWRWAVSSHGASLDGSAWWPRVSVPGGSAMTEMATSLYSERQNVDKKRSGGDVTEAINFSSERSKFAVAILGSEQVVMDKTALSQLFSQVGVGTPTPLGATCSRTAVNFAVHIGNGAGAVSLVLFTEASLDVGEPVAEVELCAKEHRTGNVWHVELSGLGYRSLLYAWRVCPIDPNPPVVLKDAVDAKEEVAEAVGATKDVAGVAGLVSDAVPALSVEILSPAQRFNGERFLLDPYAKGVLSSRRIFGDISGKQWPVMAGAVPKMGNDFDWEGDKPPGLKQEDLIIYEAHVRGFTISDDSGIAMDERGTYAGMVRKLDYLQRLGINALELMPIHEFNELEYYDPKAPVRRINFWGYSTINYFSPNARFSAAAARGSPRCDAGRGIAKEFKMLVRECHKRGIEVILDVVFNHTAEGNEKGPTLSFRGLDNTTYYMLAPEGEYYNFSGCGNTVNCNHPVVRDFILDCLRYWVEEMHVDGFRFDLASIMTRACSNFDGGLKTVNGKQQMTDGTTPTGTPLNKPPLVQMISEDPVLTGTKLIAEAWDADGLFQVGAFPHFGRWAEWNGVYRDNVRNFIKGTDGGDWTGKLGAALCGSLNIYKGNQPDPENWWANNAGRSWFGCRGQEASINFVTIHDGFTLADSVSYDVKHNEANGENNKDGENHNLSWNCGCEGETKDKGILGVRERQMRNFMVTLFLSQGVPMFMMGDEYGHTKRGNNNTYCHDNELNWFSWTKAKEEEGRLSRFVKHMIRLRKSTPELRQSGGKGVSSISWHGPSPNAPDWSSKSIAFSMPVTGPCGSALYVCFNASHDPMLVSLPRPPGSSKWEPFVDTSRPPPYDVLALDEHMSSEQLRTCRSMLSTWTDGNQCAVQARSCVILLATPEPKARQGEVAA